MQVDDQRSGALRPGGASFPSGENHDALLLISPIVLKAQCRLPPVLQPLVCAVMESSVVPVVAPFLT
jgi:hypothetical protein